jgi:hypothetical protein
MGRHAIGIDDVHHAVGIEMPLVDLELGAADQLGMDPADTGLGGHPPRQLERVGADIVLPKPVDFGLHRDGHQHAFAFGI